MTDWFQFQIYKTFIRGRCTPRELTLLFTWQKKLLDRPFIPIRFNHWLSIKWHHTYKITLEIRVNHWLTQRTLTLVKQLSIWRMPQKSIFLKSWCFKTIQNFFIMLYLMSCRNQGKKFHESDEFNDIRFSKMYVGPEKIEGKRSWTFYYKI